MIKMGGRKFSLLHDIWTFTNLDLTPTYTTSISFALDVKIFFCSSLLHFGKSVIELALFTKNSSRPTGFRLMIELLKKG